jgi:hypothetical protein
MSILAAIAVSLVSLLRADSARVVGSTVFVEPLGLEVGLPVEWLGAKDTTRRPQNCGHDVRGPLERRFITSKPALASLLNAGGEWDREYSAVTDTILPFANLVAHLGPEPFGGGGCFADLQMRVYVLADTTPVLPRAQAGLRTARGFFQTAQIASRDSAQWHIVRLSWEARYYDYGGEANVEIFSAPFRGHTVALVFMHASWPTGPAERDQRFILENVRLR